MKKTPLICLLVLVIAISACKIRDMDSHFNETCQKEGYDFAIPVSIGNETAGFNCCKMAGNHVDCDRFYSVDDGNEVGVYGN